MTNDKLKALSVQRDEMIKRFVNDNVPIAECREELQKLVKDYKTMETTLFHSTASMLEFAYETLFSKFNELEKELDILNEHNQVLLMVETLNKLHTYWHDLQVELSGILKGAIADSFGVNSLADWLYEFGNKEDESLFQPIVNVKNIEDRISLIARILNSHSFSHATYEEDENKFTIINDPCGSGQRFWREKNYQPEGRAKMINQPHPITLNRGTFPSYCTHCIAWFVILPTQKGMPPIAIIYPPEHPEDKCIWHLYKDPAQIPSNYLDLLTPNYSP